MKKVLFIIFVLLSMQVASSQTRFSAVTPSGHIIGCCLNIPGHVGVGVSTSNQSISGTLIIPDSVEYANIKYPVTYIATGNLYYDHGWITAQGFLDCSALTSVILPSTITEIMQSAFNGCTGLTSVSLNTNLITIGSFAFNNCSSLSSLSIPNTVTSIGDYAFSGCSSLTNIIIPGNVNNIGGNAFNGCTGITTIEIQEGVATIGSQAFYQCTSLEQMAIANSVLSIGSSAFCGCASLQNLILPDSLPSISNGLCQNCTGLENVTIPNTVAYIQSNAFCGCSSLFSVTVPNSVLSIETNAFGGVFNVVYNGTATGAPWGAYAVNGYIQDSNLYSDNTMTTLLRAHSHVTTANIPSSVTTIGAGAFQNCTGITNLTIGGNVQSIGENAFQGCTGLTTLNYNTTASCSFMNNQSLTNVTLGNNVISIADNMFFGCSGLSSVSLPNSIQTIGQNAFRSAGITSVDIPSSCTSIGNYAFYGCPLAMVVAEPVTPPSLGSSALSSNPLIYIPCGTYSVYYNMWYQYRNNLFEPTVEFVLNVLASEGGQAYATSEISCVDSTATISATSDYGYHFDHWSDGNTDNPRTIHVTSDTTVTAVFARNSYTITLNSSNETMGSTTGSGTYLYGDTATLMAVPIDHYHFMRWRTTNYYGYETSIHENPYNVIVTNDMVLTADFAIDTYYVNVIPNEVTRGSVTGGGYAEYGQPITVSATPYSGYQFVRWSNGAEYNPYTFAVTSDMTLEAVFMEEGTVYHVEATSDNSVMGTVTGGGPYATGETAVLTAVAYPGYHFIRWQDNVTENPRSYLVTQDATFVAYFEANVGIVNINNPEIIMYAKDYQIHIDKAFGQDVSIYTIDGRTIASLLRATEHVAIPVTTTGVYIVKIGNHPARKVVVIR